MNQKKSKESTLENRRGGAMLTGLLLASCITLCSFEWANFDNELFNSSELSYNETILAPEVIPITVRTKKIKQKVKVESNIFEIVDELPFEEEIPFEQLELDEEEFEVEYIDLEPDPVDGEPKIFIIVEQMPEFPGGNAALQSYIKRNTNYPQLAIDAGIEGVVYVQFVIGTDGQIEEAFLPTADGRTVKIGGGCDEEALRVVKKMPKWKPGKQRGMPVKVRCAVPVHFDLH